MPSWSLNVRLTGFKCDVLCFVARAPRGHSLRQHVLRIEWQNFLCSHWTRTDGTPCFWIRMMDIAGKPGHLLALQFDIMRDDGFKIWVRLSSRVLKVERGRFVQSQLIILHRLPHLTSCQKMHDEQGPHRTTMLVTRTFDFGLPVMWLCLLLGALCALCGLSLA